MASRSDIARVVVAGIVLACGAAMAATTVPGKAHYGKPNHQVLDISLVQLISEGARFDGKLVRVLGVIRVEFEGNGLFLSKEHLRHGISKNAVWIDPDYKRLGTSQKELSRLNGQYVLVEGRFDANRHGHFGAYSGTIKDISRVMSWEK